MKYLILLGLLAAALAGDSFISFSRQFNKSYKTVEEYEARKAIFQKNLEEMTEHNKRYAAGEISWWKKVHVDMDLTPEEFLAKRAGGIPKLDSKSVVTDTLDERIQAKLKAMGPAPKEVDWVAAGKVSSVKNQGGCGSCAAFSVIGSVESCYMIKGDMANDLSEQHILDCAYNHFVNDESGSWGAFGCDGAWPNAYMDWLQQGEYNQEETAYPYTSGWTLTHGACNPSSSGFHSASQVTGMHNKWYMAEMEMEALVAINPVSASLQATGNWGGYGGGVLDDWQCCNTADDPSCVYQANHAILVVGYGTQGGQDYWLIKNSWDTTWGDKGFLKLKKGTGHCAVGTVHQTIPVC